MANSKVILNEETLIDLTSDTVTSSAFQTGYTATSANGEKITGTIRKNYTKEIIEKTISVRYENSTVGAVGSFAFFSCPSLIGVSMPNCSVLHEYAFANCSRLENIYFQNVTDIGSSAFSACSYLTSAIFPKAVFIGQSAFDGCRSMSYASFPLLTNVSFTTFRFCVMLHSLVLPAVSVINGNAFMSCLRLTDLYLLSNSVVQLTTSTIFSSTPIGGYSDTAGQYGSVYVRASLLTDYRTAENWSYISSRIVGLTDSQISDLQT